MICDSRKYDNTYCSKQHILIFNLITPYDNESQMCLWLHLIYAQSMLITIYNLNPSLLCSYNQGPLLLGCWTLISAWRNNHMPSKVWEEITYQCPNIRSYTIEIWEFTSSNEVGGGILDSPRPSVCLLTTWFPQHISSLLLNFNFKFHMHIDGGRRQKPIDFQRRHFQNSCQAAILDFCFSDSNFSLALNINSNFSDTILIYTGRSLLIFSNVICKNDHTDF